MSRHDVQTIGRVTIDGASVTKSQRPLVAALALTRRGGATVDMLVDAVWPSSAPPSARQSIRNQICRLRHSFGSDLIVTSADRYVLTATTDVDTIDRVTPWCDRPALTSAETAVVADVLASWVGEPYADLPDHPIAHAERARLHHVRDRLVETLALHHLTSPDGDPQAAIIDLRVRTATAPLHEQAWQLLVVALHLVGRRTEALGVYERCREVLDQHIGAAPSKQFQQLRSIIEADRPVDPASVLSPDGPSSPIPLHDSPIPLRATA